MSKQDFFEIEEKIKGLKPVYRREPSEKFMFSSKSRLINHLILAEKEKVLKSKWIFGPKLAVGFLITIFALAMGLGSFASEKAIPGQILYPLKRFNESLIIATALSPEQKAMFKVEITKRRVDEIVQLVDEQHYEEIDKASQELKEAVEDSKNEIEKLPEDKKKHSEEAAKKSFKEVKAKLRHAVEKSDHKSLLELEELIETLEEDDKDEDEGEVKGKKHGDKKHKDRDDRKEEPDEDEKL